MTDAHRDYSHPLLNYDGTPRFTTVLMTAEEDKRRSARIAALEALLQRTASDLYLYQGAGVHSPDCPAWAEDLLKAIEQELPPHD